MAGATPREGEVDLVIVVVGEGGPSARVPDWVSRSSDSSPRFVAHATVRAGNTPGSPPSVRSASGVEGPAAASQLAVSARGQVGGESRREARPSNATTHPQRVELPYSGCMVTSRAWRALFWADRTVDPVTTGLE